MTEAVTLSNVIARTHFGLVYISFLSRLRLSTHNRTHSTHDAYERCWPFDGDTSWVDNSLLTPSQTVLVISGRNTIHLITGQSFLTIPDNSQSLYGEVLEKMKYNEPEMQKSLD